MTSQQKHNRLYNEGGEGYVPGVEQANQEISDNIEARFRAEWTREVTIQRRQEWNDRVQSGEFSGKPFSVVSAAWKSQGWDCNQLKAAIKNHSL